MSAYGPRRRRQPAGDEPQMWVEESAVKHMYVPLFLLTIGILTRLIIVIVWPIRGPGGVHPSLGEMLLGVTIEMAVNVALGVLALFVAAMLLGVNFGPIPHAARKMAAMSIVAGLIGSVCIRIDPDPDRFQGLVMALHAIPIAYWIMMYALFDLDLQETLIAVLVVGVIQGFAACVMLKA